MDSSLSALLAAGCGADGVTSASNPFLSAAHAVAERASPSFLAYAAGVVGTGAVAPQRISLQPRSRLHLQGRPLAHAGLEGPDPALRVSSLRAMQQAWSDSSLATRAEATHHAVLQSPACVEQQQRGYTQPSYSYAAAYPPMSPQPQYFQPNQLYHQRQQHFGAVASHSSPGLTAPATTAAEATQRVPVAVVPIGAVSSVGVMTASSIKVLSSPSAAATVSASDAAATHAAASQSHAADAAASFGNGMPTAEEIRRRLDTLDSLWRQVNDAGLDGIHADELDSLFSVPQTSAAAVQRAATSTVQGNVGAGAVDASVGGAASAGLFDHLAAVSASQYGPEFELDDGLLLGDGAIGVMRHSGSSSATVAQGADADVALEQQQRIREAVEQAWMEAASLHDGDAPLLWGDEPSLFTGPSGTTALSSAPTAVFTYALGDPALNTFLTSSDAFFGSSSSVADLHRLADAGDAEAVAGVLMGAPAASTLNGSEGGAVVAPAEAAAAAVSAAAEGLFQRALAAHAEGAIRATAIPAFEAVLHLQPDHSQAWRMLGECHAEQDDDRFAIGCFQCAVDADPYNRGALLSLGVSLVNEGAAAEAAATLESWLRSDPRFHGTLSGGDPDPYDDGSELDRVTRLLLAAEALAPGEPDLAEAVGVLYNTGGHFGEAVAQFQRALALSARPSPAESARLLNRIGASLAHKAAHAEAVSAYERALALRPRFARGWLNAGISHFSQKAFEAAAHCYLRALQANPTAGHIWALLRSSLLQLDRLDLVTRTEACNPNAFAGEFGIVAEQ